MDYLSITLHVLCWGIRSSDLYNTNPILPLQYDNVQYPHKDFVITTPWCGLCVAQQGKSKATEVESIKIASVSCLSFLSHSFNFFPPLPYFHVLASFFPQLPPSPPFRWKSIPLPPLPALLPPHIWSPLHSLVLSLGSRMGVGVG